MATSVSPPMDYVCINCAEPGAVGEIHIYSAENEFERSLTILEALGEIFTSGNLAVAQEAKVTTFMCSKCAEAISYMYQYFNNLLQLSHSSAYIRNLISQVDTWHHQQEEEGGGRIHEVDQAQPHAEFMAYAGGGEDGENYDFHSLETAEETTVYAVQAIMEEVVTTKRKVGRPRTKLMAKRVNKVVDRKVRTALPKVKNPFGSGNIKERRLIQCSYCPEKFLMNLRLHEHIFAFHEQRPKCQCHRCEFQYYPDLIKFETHKCLTEQQRSAPDAEQPLICEVCGVRYGGDRLMMYHMEQVHAQENFRYKCHQCSTNTATRHTLHRHIERAHTRVRTYLCGCGEEFEQKQGLTDHLPCERMLTCAVCKKVFSRKGLLLSHQRYKHRPPPPQFKCPVCDKPHFSQLKYERHVRSHSGKPSPDIKRAPSRARTYRCGCGVKFEQKQGLAEHLPCDGMFPCTVCNKVFSRRGLLLSHQRNQHRPHPPQFKCPICDKPHFSKHTLDRHVRTHEAVPVGEKEDSSIVIMEVDSPESKVTIGQVGTVRRSTLRISGSSNVQEAETIKVWKCRLCHKYFSVNLSQEEHMAKRHQQKYC